MKKYYKLYMKVEGKDIKIHRHFNTRYGAVDFAMKHYPIELEIDHRNKHTKHEIEYYLNDYNRFTVERIKKEDKNEAK